MTARASRDVPPPGAPAHWPHMPWRARRAWIARHTAPAEAESLPARIAREAYAQAMRDLATAPRMVSRPTAETARLVRDYTAEGLQPLDILGRLQMKPGAVEKALRAQGAPEMAAPYRTLARRLLQQQAAL